VCYKGDLIAGVKGQDGACPISSLQQVCNPRLKGRSLSFYNERIGFMFRVRNFLASSIELDRSAARQGSIRQSGGTRHCFIFTSSEGCDDPEMKSSLDSIHCLSLKGRAIFHLSC
jgi:hypothetical protein